MYLWFLRFGIVTPAGDYGHANVGGSDVHIRVKSRQIGKVNGGAVIDSLELAASVELTGGSGS